ncbi:MAG: hypothetical protein R3E32_09235 [Chitinophagales bacterium]
MKKNILLIALFLSYCVCNAQESNTIISMEDLNIPYILTSEAITIGKNLSDSILLKDSIEQNLIWRKRIVREVEKDELYFSPFDVRDYVSINYWDTTLIEKKQAHLLTELYDLALKGNLKCLSFDGKKEYKKREIKALSRSRDRVVMEGTVKEYRQQSYVRWKGLKRMIVIEEWQQTDNGIPIKKVLAIAPIYQEYDDNTGGFLGNILMCWFIL